MSGRFDAVAARLIAASQSIAAARVEELRLQRRDPAARWRLPALLWPRFTKG